MRNQDSLFYVIRNWFAMVENSFLGPKVFFALVIDVYKVK